MKSACPSKPLNSGNTKATRIPGPLKVAIVLLVALSMGMLLTAAITVTGVFLVWNGTLALVSVDQSTPHAVVRSFWIAASQRKPEYAEIRGLLSPDVQSIIPEERFPTWVAGMRRELNEVGIHRLGPHSVEYLDDSLARDEDGQRARVGKVDVILINGKWYWNDG
jgi:hypothetical protein